MSLWNYVQIRNFKYTFPLAASALIFCHHAELNSMTGNIISISIIKYQFLQTLAQVFFYCVFFVCDQSQFGTYKSPPWKTFPPQNKGFEQGPLLKDVNIYFPPLFSLLSTRVQ